MVQKFSVHLVSLGNFREDDRMSSLVIWTCVEKTCRGPRKEGGSEGG